jgi:hypothetical protein
MAFDSDNSMHVVWVNASNNMLYRKKTLGGWQGEENVSGLGSSYRQYYPVIAIDSNGYFHVAWYGTGWGSYPNKTNIQYRKRTTGWLSQVALTDTDSYNGDCTIALEQYDTNQDACYFGVWVNKKTLQIRTYAEGDITLVTCPDAEHFNAEIKSMNEFYSEGFITKTIDESGEMTVYRQDRNQFFIKEGEEEK